jgi:LPXTG-motif cell wall-anchored protein
MPGIQPCGPPDVVEGGAIPDIVLGGVITPADNVLGGRLPGAPSGAVLPMTGPGAISSFLLAALGLMSAGLMALRGRRRK